MKDPLILILFLAIFFTAPAQVAVDSVQQKLDLASHTDLNSLQSRLTHLPDSLLPAYHKIDSIRNDFNLAADGIQTQYRRAVSKIEAQADKLNQTIDSLERVNLPSNRYKKIVDSLNAMRQSAESKFTSRLNDLKTKTTDKLNSLDLPPDYREPLHEVAKNVNGRNLNSDVIKIPELKVPGYTLPEIDGIGDLTSKAGELGDLKGVGKMSGIETPIGDLDQVAQQAKGYQKDIQNVTRGNLNDVKALPETIEVQASKIEGMEELQKQSGLIDEHKARLEDFKDPDKAKEKVVEVARKAATDHFAGKQEQLKSAMEKISKYKQKYSSVSSIKDLPKRPPNVMKGKRFVERLVRGLYLQYQQKDSYLLDVNPYMGYMISGRFTAGLGWNQRYAYDKNSCTLISRSKIFGPRGYVDFKLGKGFIAHIEGESMNSFVPSTLVGNPDTGYRQWVWSFMTGIKKEYKIYKNLKGTALIQYNVFNRYYRSPYVDRLNSRIGFEYVLKSKKRKADIKKQ